MSEKIYRTPFWRSPRSSTNATQRSWRKGRPVIILIQIKVMIKIHEFSVMASEMNMLRFFSRY
eukprot:bmy_02884T0